jgi:hypothetical protein
MRLAQQFWAASRKKSLRAKQLFRNRRVQMGSQQNHTHWTVSPTPQTLHKLENPPRKRSAGRLYRDVFSYSAASRQTQHVPELDEEQGSDNIGDSHSRQKRISGLIGE